MTSTAASRRPSLVRVLLLAIGGVAVGAVVLTALVTFGLARLDAPERTLRQLDREVERVAEVAAGLPCEGRLGPALTREFGPRVRFVPEGVRGPRVRFGQISPPRGRTSVGGRDTYYSSTSTTLCGRPGRLFVFQESRETALLPEGFTSRLVLAAVAGLAGAALVAYVLARRMSRPLGELAHSARAVARGDATRVDAISAGEPAEIADLKTAFAGMVGDLSKSRDREKAFLLSVSHELRTPLTAIRGYGEALSDGTARESAHAGEVIARESKRLERLVQDLLDLARLSSGEFSVHAERVDLADVAASAIEAMRPSAKENGVRLELDAPERFFAHTDPDRVHQMIANLVENAIRMTPEGESVSIEVRAGRIAVVDRGPGIEPEDVGRAFERFYLWRKYRGVRSVGSGLGLAIVGELADRLGVGVEVSPGPAGGTRFELRFDA